MIIIYTDKEIKSIFAEFKATEQGVIEGYAAYFDNVDSYQDVIVKGAFADATNKSSEVKLMWNHNWDTVPIGTVTMLLEDEKGLSFRAELNNTALAKDVKEGIKSGAVTKMSIGYTTEDSETVEKEGKTLRMIKKIKLFEISPVNFPANDMATIQSYKSDFHNEILEELKVLKMEVESVKALVTVDSNESDDIEVITKLNGLIKKVGGK